MRETSIPAACEIEIPTAELLHPRTGRVGAATRYSGHRPGHVEKVSGVSHIALVAVRGGAHFREKLGSLFLAKLVEEHRGHATLPTGTFCSFEKL